MKYWIVAWHIHSLTHSHKYTKDGHLFGKKGHTGYKMLLINYLYPK